MAACDLANLENCRLFTGDFCVEGFFYCLCGIYNMKRKGCDKSTAIHFFLVIKVL